MIITKRVNGKLQYGWQDYKAPEDRISEGYAAVVKGYAVRGDKYYNLDTLKFKAVEPAFIGVPFQGFRLLVRSVS